jgi:hypothetical protein
MGNRYLSSAVREMAEDTFKLLPDVHPMVSEILIAGPPLRRVSVQVRQF